MWVFLYKLVAAGRKSLTLSRLILQAHSAYVSMCLSVCACVCVHTCEPFLLFPIFRKSAGASHSSGPQRMTSYCGFGAPEQLDEFMVSAKKRRSLSFCQSWFPPRFKCWPPRAAKGGRGPQACIKKEKKKRWGKWNVSEPCSDSVFTSCNYILLLSNRSRNMPLYFDAW